MKWAPKTGPRAKVYLRRLTSESPSHKVDTGSGTRSRSTTGPDSEKMKGKQHDGKGGGYDSHNEHQTTKTCILKLRLDYLNPSLRLAETSRPWESG